MTSLPISIFATPRPRYRRRVRRDKESELDIVEMKYVKRTDAVAWTQARARPLRRDVKLTRGRCEEWSKCQGWCGGWALPHVNRGHWPHIIIACDLSLLVYQPLLTV